MRRTLTYILAALSLLIIMGQSSCESRSRADRDRQEQIVDRARSQNPIPDLQHSQTYDSVVKWLRRWDSPDKVSYVYILADNGQIIGYYVAQGRPVSTCTFLTNPQTEYGSSGRVALPAPALDGTYYGNCGESSVFFFTAETDAFIEVGGLNYFVTDQPLGIEAQEFTVALQEE